MWKRLVCSVSCQWKWGARGYLMDSVRGMTIGLKVVGEGEVEGANSEYAGAESCSAICSMVAAILIRGILALMSFVWCIIPTLK
jgi:hypothetical protein